MATRKGSSAARRTEQVLEKGGLGGEAERRALGRAGRRPEGPGWAARGELGQEQAVSDPGILAAAVLLARVLLENQHSASRM